MIIHKLDDDVYKDVRETLKLNQSVLERLDINIIQNKEYDNLLLERILVNFPDEQFLKADGFDEAVIGVDLKTMRLIYSVSKCLDILMESMTLEDAWDYFYFNMEGSYVGESTPIWCMDENF